MWIFCLQGFFSITTSRDDPKKLQIRAREKADLEQLCSTYGLSAEILETPAADYRFRVIVEPTELATLMQMLVYSIGYGNFKDAMSHSPEQAHKAPYLARVWSTMQQLQPVDPLPERDPYEGQLPMFENEIPSAEVSERCERCDHARHRHFKTSSDRELCMARGCECDGFVEHERLLDELEEYIDPRDVSREEQRDVLENVEETKPAPPRRKKLAKQARKAKKAATK